MQNTDILAGITLPDNKHFKMYVLTRQNAKGKQLCIRAGDSIDELACNCIREELVGGTELGLIVTNPVIKDTKKGVEHHQCSPEEIRAFFMNYYRELAKWKTCSYP